MRILLSILIMLGLAAWIGVLQRKLQAARACGDMYRAIARRLDRRVVELSGREQ